MRGRTILWSTLWAVSLMAVAAISAAVTWRIARLPQPNSMVPSPPSTIAFRADFATETSTAVSLPAAPAAQPPESPTHPEDQANGQLQLALRQALRQMAENYRPASTTEDPPKLINLWNHGYARFHMQKNSGTFGGMDESLNLSAEMARHGEPGMRFLSGIVHDASHPMEERELALSVLSHIRNKAALATILKINAPDVTELDYPYDLIVPQIAALPTNEVRPFIPDILGQIQMDMGANDPAPERPEVLTILALVHGDARAQALLQDPRIFDEDLAQLPHHYSSKT